MSTATVERMLRDAFADARRTVSPSEDLFARVHLSIADARARRRWRWRLALQLAAVVVALAALALLLSLTSESKGMHMDWWIIELITNLALVGIAVGLGPFIKRFGRAYAADVFRANPRTGKSYLVLTDVAYYLIFTAFILFTVTFVAPEHWPDSPGEQLKHEVARVGGILLIMGILHALNVVALPVIGRLLSLNKRLDPVEPVTATTGTVPPLGPGTWILHIEPGPDAGS